VDKSARGLAAKIAAKAGAGEALSGIPAASAFFAVLSR
jgi:hypothetical protein